MEPLKHECGVAMIRLLKPLEYYQQKYGTWMYALNKLYLMMEKQHNRGQEGAGMACVKLGGKPGHEYMFRERAEGKNAVTEIFGKANANFKSLTPEQLADAKFAKEELPFAGELYMGHLRYSTTGKSGIQYVHPFLRRNNWKAKNLCLCGNFNMTNVDEIFEELTKQGQSPRIYSDTYIMLELMGHRLDREVERNFVAAKAMEMQNTDITNYIEDHVKMSNVLKTTMKNFDGGYVVCGITGSGEMFSMRDPWGIRLHRIGIGVEGFEVTGTGGKRRSGEKSYCMIESFHWSEILELESYAETDGTGAGLHEIVEPLVIGTRGRGDLGIERRLVVDHPQVAADERHGHADLVVEPPGRQVVAQSKFTQADVGHAVNVV